MDAGRLAGLATLALLLLLPAGAQAHHPRAEETALIGAQHMREHMKIWRVQDRARAEWQKMTPAERRRARRAQRRADRRAYVRAQAAADEPSDVGQWAAPFVMTSNYQGYAIHAAMLRTGKVLMWGYPIHVEQAAWRGNESYAWLWDPSLGSGANAVEDVTPVIGGENVSIYCSGMSFLPDGRVLVVGGTLTWGEDDPDFPTYTEFAGLDTAILFDPATESWTELPRPAGSDGRWYPTQTLLPDGRTLVISGISDESPGGLLNNTLEIYDSAGGSPVLLDSVAQRRDMELYPHMFTMPDGDLLMAGPNPDDSARFDPENLSDPWTDLPPLSGQRIGGNALLLPEGPSGSTQVAAIGGRPYGPTVPLATNEMIDLDDASPSWTSFPALSVQRSYPNTLLLPDRSMVTIGGDDRVEQTWPDVPEKAVELYDPVTNSWQTGPRQVEKRAYHSTAVLLPDGRILSTGDDLNPTADGSRAGASPNDTGEIYSPPYLFKGPRPVISSAPDALRWNVPFGVGTSGDVDEAVLIAPAATTHGNDMNQRLVPLQTVGTSDGGVTLQSPPSANVAPPGWYMLFLVERRRPVRRDVGAPRSERGRRADHAAARPRSRSGSRPAARSRSEPGPGARRSRGSRGPGDLSAPELRLRFAERTWLDKLRRYGRLNVRVTVDEPATVQLKFFRGDRRVARARGEMDAGKRTFELHPRRRTLRWLRRADSPRLRLTAVAVDQADNDTAWSRLLRP